MINHTRLLSKNLFHYVKCLSFRGITCRVTSIWPTAAFEGLPFLWAFCVWSVKLGILKAHHLITQTVCRLPSYTEYVCRETDEHEIKWHVAPEEGTVAAFDCFLACVYAFCRFNMWSSVKYVLGAFFPKHRHGFFWLKTGWTAKMQ